MIQIENWPEALKIDKFPDGTFKINIDPNIYYGPYPGDISIKWLYEKEEELVILFYIVSHIRNYYKDTCIILNMPYVPNARMDRCESPENVFTLKYFCNFINSLNFDEVRISDPHSNVSEALINRVTVERGSKIVSTRINFMNNYLKKEGLPPINLLFFPDEGAMKRYSKDCDQPFAFGIKKRDWDTGAIVDYKVEGDIPAESNILIVDDICSYGGTFYNAAKILKEKYKANKVYLFVTHCENSVLLGKLPDTEYVDHVFTTGTIFTEKSDFVTVI